MLFFGREVGWEHERGEGVEAAAVACVAYRKDAVGGWGGGKESLRSTLVR